jgi:2-iminobutanoate/2-iminopropanoate deaminase
MRRDPGFTPAAEIDAEFRLRIEPVEAADGPRAQGGYSQALRVTGASQLLFISGQIPEDGRGIVPEGFEDQCRQVWTNLTGLLAESGLGIAHLVKVTTFLSDRRHAEANSRIRREYLGPHRPALTVVVAEIFDRNWLLEIEAIAAG